MQYASASLHPKEIVDKLRNLNIKIFFISGDRDSCFIDSVKRVVQDIKNSKLMIFRDCGHVCTIEKHKEFNQCAIRFLNNCHSYA